VFQEEVTSKIDVKLQSASEKAISSITRAGGSFQRVRRVRFVSKENSEDQS